jgi:nickel-dependent lactate racemase
LESNNSPSKSLRRIWYECSGRTRFQACPDPIAEIQRALDHPLGTPPIEQIVNSGEEILILLDDHTRDTPVKLLLQQQLERLTKAITLGQNGAATQALIEQFGGQTKVVDNVTVDHTTELLPK